MMQNLLSKKQKTKLRHEYYYRFWTVFALLLSGAFLAGNVALIPSYVKVLDGRNSRSAELTMKQENAKDNKALNQEVVQAAAMLEFFSKDLDDEKLTELMNETLALRPQGITITGYAYDKEQRTLHIEGLATTRDLVAPYARSLEESEVFLEAPVPFSDLAKNTNLKFRLTTKLTEE